MASEDEEMKVAEKMRELAELKEDLERKISGTESELKKLRILLEFVNKTLLEKGFRRAGATETGHPQTSALPPVADQEAAIPLKAASGEILANLYVSQDSARVVVAEGESFSVKTPPFQQFLIERVLSKMQEKDREAVVRGELSQEDILSYDLIQDGDILREIEVRNLTSDRLRELKSSVHWTLEKMCEKTKKGT
jgi:hypothetical protein